jgi:Undecaprenyl-phosphate glucose phosphotransferase
MERFMNISTMTARYPVGSRNREVPFTQPAAPSVKGPISEPVVCGLVATLDGLLILFSGLWAASFAGVDRTASPHIIAAVTLLGAILSINLWHVMGAYRFTALQRFKRGFAVALSGLSIMVAAQFALALSLGEVTKPNMAWLGLWFAAGVVLLGTARAVVRMRIASWTHAGRLTERVAIVGATIIAREFLHNLRAGLPTREADPHMHVVGVFDDMEHPALPGQRRGKDAIGSMESLIDLIRRNCVDTVIIAMPLSEDERIAAILDKLQHVAVDVRLCPDHFGLRMGQFTVSRCGSHSLLNVVNKPMRDWRQVAKKVEDMVLGTIIFALISPLLLGIAIAIKIDSPGPVLFRQKRFGFNNQLIEVLKFRSMHHAMSDPNAEKLATRNDPRITKLGAFLRRTSLDELPQFINVLRGEMSIVGPRPHAIAAKAGTLIYHDAVQYYDARHRVKPGITGWAQVNGWRGETQTVEQIVRRVEHDLFYVENWSIAMDLKIILRTIFGGFTGKSAY